MPIVRTYNLDQSAGNLAQKVEQGRLYTLVDETAGLAGSGTFELCLRTNGTKITVDLLSLASTSVESTIQLREGVVFTDLTGDTLTSFNRNRNFKTVPFPVNNAEKNPTVIDAGTLLEEFTVFGQAGQGGNKPAFSSGEIPIPFILEPNSTYMIRVTNDDTSSRDYRAALYLSY